MHAWLVLPYGSGYNLLNYTLNIGSLWWLKVKNANRLRMGLPVLCIKETELTKIIIFRSNGLVMYLQWRSSILCVSFNRSNTTSHRKQRRHCVSPSERGYRRPILGLVVVEGPTPITIPLPSIPRGLNALVALLVLWVSMFGGNRIPSGYRY